MCVSSYRPIYKIRLHGDRYQQCLAPAHAALAASSRTFLWPRRDSFCSWPGRVRHHYSKWQRRHMKDAYFTWTLLQTDLSTLVELSHTEADSRPHHSKTTHISGHTHLCCDSKLQTQSDLRRILTAAVYCSNVADTIHGLRGFCTVPHRFGGRSRWPRGLRRRSAAERLLGSWVRIPPVAWMFVLYSVCVVRYKSLWRADPSSRGVLPTVVCLWVWSSGTKQPRHLLWVVSRDKGYETKPFRRKSGRPVSTMAWLRGRDEPGPESRHC
jgi:hypothetical protein